MDIFFKSKKIKKMFESPKKYFGDRAKVVEQRIQELAAADSLMVISKLPGAQFHPLKENRCAQFAINAVYPYRIIFEPYDCQNFEYQDIKKIIIIDYTNYHKGRG